MNLYCRLNDAKAAIGGVPESVTDRDTEIIAAIAAASRAQDEHCGRHFYALDAQTRYANWRGATMHDRSLLWLPVDVVSISALVVDDDGDGTYELTLVENTDYWAEPDDRETNEPITRLRLNPNGLQIWSWPAARRSVKLTCVEGYSRQVTAIGTLGAAISSTTATSVTMTAGHGLQAGDLIVVDSEQIYVSAVSTNTLTVERGANGSTAATHSNGATVSRRVYPANITAACAMRAARIFRGAHVGHGVAVGPDSMGGVGTALYPVQRDLEQPFVRGSRLMAGVL